jgi:hypothetical protein
MHIIVIQLNKEKEIYFNCLSGNELAFVIKELGSGMGAGGGGGFIWLRIGTGSGLL